MQPQDLSGLDAIDDGIATKKENSLQKGVLRVSLKCMKSDMDAPKCCVLMNFEFLFI